MASPRKKSRKDDDSPFRDGTIGDLVRFAIPDVDRKKLGRVHLWAPNAFAIAGYILHKTGAYLHALNDETWPKKKHPGYRTPNQLRDIGKTWRERMSALDSPFDEDDKTWSHCSPPSEVCDDWRILIKHLNTKLRRVGSNLVLVRALLDIVACADAACDGFGLPPEVSDKPLMMASDLLSNSYFTLGASTLSTCVAPSTLCILPKLHTPQIGMTFRCLSHHLALWPRDELSPLWASEVVNGLTTKEDTSLNILLVPYPYKLRSSQFTDLKIKDCGRHKMPDGFGFVGFHGESNKTWLTRNFPQLLKAAVKTAGNVDAVIFPELSLLGVDEMKIAADEVLKINPRAFIVAGVQGTSRKGRGRNTAQVVVPAAMPDALGQQYVWHYEQLKHHRWQLDGPQIERYGLNDFDPATAYWEDTEFDARMIHFLPLRRSLTTCVLVCEDLARQEPASRLIRAVGPNLLVALLMDGEQHPARWSGRYAAALSEDPGCSVLTLTCRGLLEMQRSAQSKSLSKRPKALKIGLWRDSKSAQAISIEMKAKADAVVLCLRRDVRHEYSVDGRDHRTPLMHLPTADDKSIRQVIVRSRRPANAMKKRRK